MLQLLRCEFLSRAHTVPPCDNLIIPQRKPFDPMGQMHVHQTGPWVIFLCPFYGVQFSHGVGQTVDLHFDPHEKVQICNKKHPKSEDFRCFLELLGGFEPPTSSLPTGWEPSSPCVPTLSGPFCSKRMRSSVRFAPLFPSVRFPVWVTVWVNRNF